MIEILFIIMGVVLAFCAAICIRGCIVGDLNCTYNDNDYF